MAEHPSQTELPLDLLRQVDLLCERFEAALRAGRPADPAPLFEAAPQEARATLLRELVALELEYAAPGETERVLAAWSQRFPGYWDTLRGVPDRRTGRKAETDAPTTAFAPALEPGTEACGAPASLAGEVWTAGCAQPGPMPAAAGKATCLGEYELLEEVDATPGGVIYRARQASLNRTVALTVLMPECLPSPEARACFRRDAEAAARLDHPGLLRIFELAEDAGRQFIAAAQVDGESLSKRLGSGPLPDAEAATLGRQLAEAVHYAHGLGVVDGALTTARVLIGADGRARLRGFGLGSCAVPFLRMMPAANAGFLAPERARMPELQDSAATGPAAASGLAGPGDASAAQVESAGHPAAAPTGPRDRLDDTKRHGSDDGELAKELLNTDFELSGIDEPISSCARGIVVPGPASGQDAADAEVGESASQEVRSAQPQRDDEDLFYGLAENEKADSGSHETETARRAEDVYGLGAILYAALTARPPFQAATRAETLRQARDDAPLPPSRLNPRISRDLEAVCLKCLDKDPARRYGSAAELLGDLLAWLARRPVKARPGGALRRGLMWCRRNQQTVALLVIGLVVGAGPEALDWWRAELPLPAGVAPAPIGPTATDSGATAAAPTSAKSSTPEPGRGVASGPAPAGLSEDDVDRLFRHAAAVGQAPERRRLLPKLRLRSPAFPDRGRIPERYTARAQGLSPPLEWDDPPEGTKTFALLCVNSSRPPPNVHWLVYNLPAAWRSLPAFVPPGEVMAGGALQGKNHFGTIGYTGVSAPAGKTYRYYFRLWALDTSLALPAGAEWGQITNAWEGHLLAQGQLSGLCADQEPAAPPP